MLEQGLYTYLKNSSAVIAQVSDRIYPALGAQMPTLPALVYERISTASDGTMDGKGLFHPRIQISVLASTALSARTVAEAIRPALDYFSGQFADGTVIQFSRLLDERGPFFDYESNSYRSELDFEMWHS